MPLCFCANSLCNRRCGVRFSLTGPRDRLAEVVARGRCFFAFRVLFSLTVASAAAVSAFPSPSTPTADQHCLAGDVASLLETERPRRQRDLEVWPVCHLGSGVRTSPKQPPLGGSDLEHFASEEVLKNPSHKFATNSLGLSRQHALQTRTLRLDAANQAGLSILPQPAFLVSGAQVSHERALDLLDDRDETRRGERRGV